MKVWSRRHFLTSIATFSLFRPGESKEAVLKWKKHEGLTLAPYDYHDGDSFHLQSTLNSQSFHFRLYGADCPESDASLAPKRFEEQISYFGVNRSTLLHWSRKATAYTEDFLRETVTAYSAKIDALGQSEVPRFYAYVFRDSQSLSEALIHAGLARAKGYLSDFQGHTWQQIRKRYQLLENEAKAAKRGIWSAT